MVLQIATFAINYRGQPFMESLSQNKALLYSVVCSGGAVLALALGLVPDLAAQFEIIDFPPDVSIFLFHFNEHISWSFEADLHGFVGFVL